MKENQFKTNRRVHVLIPAFNESENIVDVVAELLNQRNGDARSVDTVIVCDNASTDNTAELAIEAGATVVHEPEMGYGAACLSAMAKLADMGVQGNDVVVFVDGDHSVFTPEINLMVEQLKSNRGLVVGARQVKQQERGAMSIHQQVGNIIASKMIQFIWGTKVTDLGPFRAMYYRDLVQLNMQDRKFGWTTEMQVKAIQHGLPYSELNITTRRRRGRSKISGTIKGTIGAAHGIFSTIFWLWWQARSNELSDELYR